MVLFKSIKFMEIVFSRFNIYFLPYLLFWLFSFNLAIGVKLSAKEYKEISKLLTTDIKNKYSSDSQDEYSDYVTQVVDSGSNVTKYHAGDATLPVFVCGGKDQVGKKVVVLQRGEDYILSEDETTFIVLRQRSDPKDYNVHIAFVFNLGESMSTILWSDARIVQQAESIGALKVMGNHRYPFRANQNELRPRCKWIASVLYCDSKKTVTSRSRKLPPKLETKITASVAKSTSKNGDQHSVGRDMAADNNEENDETENDEDVNKGAVLIVHETMPMDEEMQERFSKTFTGAARSARTSPDVTAKIKTIASLCGKDDTFMDFRPNHMKAYNILLSIFQDKRNIDDFIALAREIRNHPKLNYQIWAKAFVSSSIRRPDLVGLNQPSMLALNPKGFINSEPFSDIKKGRALVDGCYPIDGRYTATDNNKTEQKLWYFREDLIINMRHWNWHISYPFQDINPNTPKVDRRGELFGYFHHNLNARYHAERLGNGLRRTEPLDITKSLLLEEGYNPHLGDLGAKTGSYGKRAPNTHFTNIKYITDVLKVLIADLDANQLVRVSGTKLSLNDSKAINFVGDVLEGNTNYSFNPGRYFNLANYGMHNQLHIVIAGLSIDKNGVMGATETAVRDPVFFRWHHFVDQQLDRARKVLPPYLPTKGEYQLLWSVANLKTVVVKTNLVSGDPKFADNELRTFFKNSTISLAKTEFFGQWTVALQDPKNGVKYCVRHLEHKPFKYEFTIESSQSNDKRATIRIFMAPRFDQNGKRFSFQDQRTLFFAMDEIVVELSTGTNKIYRESKDSLVTTPSDFDGDTKDDLRRCGCGWPHHLILPRGNKDGMIFDLVVMVTNGRIDLPEYYKPKTPAPCFSSHVICGKYQELYPDARPMGYPFDRENKKVANLDEFIGRNKNMKTVQVKIVHDDS